MPKRNSRAACGAPTGHFRGHLSWRPSQQLLGCHAAAGQIGSSAGLAPGGGPGLTDAEIDVDILVLGVFLKTLVAELAALAGLLVAADRQLGQTFARAVTQQRPARMPRMACSAVLMSRDQTIAERP